MKRSAFFLGLIFLIVCALFVMKGRGRVSGITPDDLVFQKMLEESLRDEKSVLVERLYPNDWDYVFLFYGDSGTSRLKSVSCMMPPTDPTSYNLPHPSQEMKLPKNIVEGATALIFVRRFQVVSLFSLDKFAPDGLGGTCFDRKNAAFYVSKISHGGNAYFWLKREEK